MNVHALTMPLDVVSSAGGAAFLAALAALVASIAQLVKVLPALKRVERQVNGNLQKEKDRNRELRDELDAAHTEITHQRRTIEVLIERGGTRT